MPPQRWLSSQPPCEAHGNPHETARSPKNSVANVSQLVTLDKSSLTDRVGKLSKAKLELVLFGIDVVLGR
jgi:mRNA-degrading endonuclease toxin of MazEF toxin-antitoxin module